MTAKELLNKARSLGADFQVLESGGIKVQAASPLPKELMRELRDKKAAVAALLTAPGGKDTEELLSWSAQAAEFGLGLPEPVQSMEAPLRPYTTAEVGRYCHDQLKVMFMARSNRVTGGWGRFTPEWWIDMETRSLETLAAVKAATDAATRETAKGDKTE